MKLEKSKELYARAVKVIPGGVNSPVRAFRSVGGEPIFMERGEGAYLIDADNNRYLDLCNSWGPLICGHLHPVIVAAIQKQIQKSLTFGTPCEEEVLLAEYIVHRLGKLVPSVEKIRFVSSGTEAVMSALRLARGFTKKNRIIKFDGCYHGHSDSLLVKAGSGLATLGSPDSAGVPLSFTGETIVLPLADSAAVEKAFEEHKDNIAALIIEPVPANNGLLLQTKEYLQFLRDITEKHNSLLIFDEVISGFRIGFGGAAHYYGIVPDLLTYGKIIGGGMPVGAFAGRSDIFKFLSPDGPVYQAGTLSGNPVAMAAGLAALSLLDDAFYANLKETGERIAANFNKENLRWSMRQIESLFWLYEGKNPPKRADQISRESMKEYAKLHRYALEHGVYLAPSGYEVGFLSSPMQKKEEELLTETLIHFFRQT